MRAVARAEELDEAIGAARREALAAFGDGTLYVERLVSRPRHIEVQVMADRHGEVVHLFERECSIQRRHQKIVEETPSPVVSPALRASLGDAACRAARAAGYENAGTIEFLLDGQGDQARYYFLEMNTRLQVEHPITEEVAGVDLVHAQLAIAAGAPLPWRQAELSQRGHAIECRVCAEDPRAGFLPQAGRLAAVRLPLGPGIRVDAGVETGDEIPIQYDPLIAKLVARGSTRAQAIARAAAALERFVVLGVRTNLALLRRVLAHPRFREGDVDTGFIAAEREALLAAPPVDQQRVAVAAAAWVAAQGARPSAIAPAAEREQGDPWESLHGWRA
jgi:acetyl/propionyl-CoA carboxylase alpha subunit